MIIFPNDNFGNYHIDTLPRRCTSNILIFGPQLFLFKQLFLCILCTLGNPSKRRLFLVQKTPQCSWLRKWGLKFKCCQWNGVLRIRPCQWTLSSWYFLKLKLKIEFRNKDLIRYHIVTLLHKQPETLNVNDFHHQFLKLIH